MEGLDYEAIYILDSSIFGHGDFGRFTFTLNGTYLSRFEFQVTPVSKRFGLSGAICATDRLPARCRIIEPMPARSTTAQLIPGSLASILARPFTTPASMKMTISSDGSSKPQSREAGLCPWRARKVREWTTLDLIASYTFNLPPPALSSRCLA